LDTNMKLKDNLIKIMSGIVFLIMFGPLCSSLLGQNGEEIWIDPNKSDPTQRKSIILNGNRVESMVGNWGGIGAKTEPISGVWPRGSQHDHIFEFSGLVAAEVPDSNGNLVVIISDSYDDAGGTQGEFHPVTNIEYKYHPIPGYFNNEQGQDEFANWLNPESWPESWPGRDATWDGNWNGFFGNNISRSDQEAMFYVDDVWNSEFPFFPYNDEADSVRRRGLGIQLLTRFFQWAHPLAQDILFYYFEFSNAGDFDYKLPDYNTTEPEYPIYFGGFGDIGPGGRGTSDDNAWFDAEVDMFYGWDNDNIGVWSVFREIPPGYMGWKFLESPGIQIDGIDNDTDGLIDEKRDNDAGALVFGPVGKYGDPKEHFEGDEDGDWLVATDDVGADGSGPLDDGYPGPDFGEGDGIPTQGEPNFGKLDNDESDQIGLTAASAPLYGSVLVSDEEAMWPRLQPGYFEDPSQSVNQFWLFASGPISLLSKDTERFSTSFVFAFTERALFQVAGVAQRIFDSDYSFAKPPKQPTLKVIPGDGQVILMWDEISELSRDPIYGYDFEGYRIIRSTNPQFLDVEDVTDANGNAVFKVPIAQFDLNNGLTGPHPLQFGEELEAPIGAHFYMGDDTGLKHYYVDKNLVNGRTYYYAVTAYDKGYDTDFFEKGLSETEFLLPITPSESPASIVVTGGLVTRMDRNTAIATPSTRASNYEDATIEGDGVLTHLEGVATGTIRADVIDASKIRDASYTVSFDTVQGKNLGEYETSHLTIYDETNDFYVLQDEEIEFSPQEDRYASSWEVELFEEGLILSFENDYPDVEYSLQNSGWDDGSLTNFPVEMSALSSSSPLLPISFIVEFGDTLAILDTAFTNTAGSRNFGVNFKIYEVGTNRPLDFVFKDGDKDGRLDPNEHFYIVFKKDSTALRYTGSWRIDVKFPLLPGGGNRILPREEWIEPQPGDKIVFLSRINFHENDFFEFTTNASTYDSISSVSQSLDDIKVVPNPYLSSSILESQPVLSGRGERFIRFTHLPAECTVHIFTVNGDLVQTLNHDNINGGDLRWNLRSKENLEVSFVIYVFVVEAPNIGKKI